ncbi:TetR/AcrR family transcriptional regulator [Oecophyllibacter saccharovorans]|uniref:TetR/AcrR family transcriptional regulator n=1 Tax=Oecophyllibacter saccharovorans TaxID=2558360 RepID=A0A506URN8_9PROT|nr:TetR/AcrR family transcriptional regulator [Oecophyllibacter saccharovorans]TPW36014.1 TetR/AcrR family transcriptional regulator [Oecophyllibacter saccharovorans]
MISSPPTSNASPCPSPADKRSQILEGAGRVFLESGYEGASMSEIARMAGVSKGTLYNHFASKADLFSAFFRQTSSQMQAALEVLGRNDSPNLRDSLTQAAEGIINVLLQPHALGLYRIIVTEAAHFPKLADIFWHNGFASTLENLSHWFSAAAARGQLNISDPQLAADQFMMLCQTRIVQRRRFMIPVEDDPASITRIATLTAESFLRIYAP